MQAYDLTGPVSRETSERITLWVDLIHRWTGTVPLLSHGDRDAAIEQHLADSLSLIPFLGADVPMADLGSGAGFPGLAVALATGRKITLIESNRRKAAFLQEAVRLTSAPAEIHAGRIEDLEQRFGLIIARAVAPVRTLLTLVAPRLTDSGRCLFLKGPRVDDELQAASGAWSFKAECHPGLAIRRSTILSITALRERITS